MCMRGRAIVCFLSAPIRPPISRRGARTANTSVSVTNRASEGSTADDADADPPGGAAAGCAARAHVERARRRSAPARASVATARSAEEEDDDIDATGPRERRVPPGPGGRRRVGGWGGGRRREKRGVALGERTRRGGRTRFRRITFDKFYCRDNTRRGAPLVRRLIREQDKSGPITRTTRAGTGVPSRLASPSCSRTNNDERSMSQVERPPSFTPARNCEMFSLVPAGFRFPSPRHPVPAL